MFISVFLDLLFLSVLKIFTFIWPFLEGIKLNRKNTILISFQVKFSGITLSVWSYVVSLITPLMAAYWVSTLVWAPGPSHLECTSSDMFRSLFSFRICSVSNLEWDFADCHWWSKLSSLPSPLLLPSLAQVHAWLTPLWGASVLCGCTVLCFLAWGSTCYLVESLEILAQWIEGISEWGWLLRELCVWERVTSVTVK